MAVPFHVPEASVPATSAATSSSSSTTSTTTPQPQNPSGAAHNHSMPMNVVNNEYLVQALCEALYRYSRAGGSLTTPPSPSSTTCTTLYGNGEVFFNFNDLHNSHLDDIYGSPRRHRSHSWSIPPSTQSSRTTLSSQGHAMTDDEDDSPGEHFSRRNFTDEHYNCMTLREQLQEFPGRVPQRKRKTTATVLGNPQQQQQLHDNKPKDQKFAWSTIVALGVLAVGCGLLATR